MISLDVIFTWEAFWIAMWWPTFCWKRSPNCIAWEKRWSLQSRWLSCLISKETGLLVFQTSQWALIHTLFLGVNWNTVQNVGLVAVMKETNKQIENQIRVDCKPSLGLERIFFFALVPDNRESQVPTLKLQPSRRYNNFLVAANPKTSSSFTVHC